MSQKRTHEIACPFCGHEQTVDLYDSIVVDSQPELRAALLANRINRVACEKCKKDFRVDKPLVYHDREQEIFIHFDPLISGRQLDEAEESFETAMSALHDLLPENIQPPETYLVVEWTELIELIFLLEEGLDARLVEHIKYMMYQQNPTKLDPVHKGLLFDTQDSNDEQLCFVVQDRKTKKLEAMLHFSRADYEALVNIFDTPEQQALLREQFSGPYLSGRLKYLQDQVMADADDAGIMPPEPPA